MSKRMLRQFTNVVLFGVICSQPVLADAVSDVTVSTKGTCANGSALYVATNANTTQGVAVVLARTFVYAGKSSAGGMTVLLGVKETKALGCAIQDTPPVTNVAYSWHVQSAQYQ